MGWKFTVSVDSVYSSREFYMGQSVWALDKHLKTKHQPSVHSRWNMTLDESVSWGKSFEVCMCVCVVCVFVVIVYLFASIFFSIKAQNLIWFPGQTHTHTHTVQTDWGMSCSHSETSGGVTLSHILHTLFWVEDKSSWDVTCAAYVVLKWVNETGWNNRDLVNHCPH